MATHIIKIGTTHRDHKHPERSRISLSDHGKTSVKRSDTVIWVNQNPQIDSFLILFNDSRRIRLFHAAPAPLASFEGKRWKVRIDPDALKVLYRLSGDRNPLHSDPAFAAMGGFDRPILHGLCTYGFTGRALLHALCGGDPARFRSMEGRFSSPVMPGEALTIAMWRTEANFSNSA